MLIHTIGLHTVLTVLVCVPAVIVYLVFFAVGYSAHLICIVSLESMQFIDERLFSLLR